MLNALKIILHFSSCPIRPTWTIQEHWVKGPGHHSLTLSNFPMQGKGMHPTCRCLQLSFRAMPCFLNSVRRFMCSSCRFCVCVCASCVSCIHIMNRNKKKNNTYHPTTYWSPLIPPPFWNFNSLSSQPCTFSPLHFLLFYSYLIYLSSPVPQSLPPINVNICFSFKA